MGKDKFNPYNSSQYFNLPKPAPEYDPSRTLSGPDIYGLLNVRSQAEIDRVRREADEAMRRSRELWQDNQLGLHSGPMSAWNASMGYESCKGEKDCTGGSD